MKHPRPLLPAILLASTLTLAAPAAAQHLWQKPTPVPRAEVAKLVGLTHSGPFSQPRHIVWCWSYDRPHRPGGHDYTRVRDLMVEMLKEVPDLTVETAYLFPTAEQFKRADLVVMFLHPPTLEKPDYALLDPYIERGGGLVAIHETMIIRPKKNGHMWADRIGLGWSEGTSTWGALFTDVEVDNTHPIFTNFPKKVPIVDEFYWHLAKARNERMLDILAEASVGPPRNSNAPVPEIRLGPEKHPVFWTMRHGTSRVFCSLPGHNTFTYYDPRFRTILLRGMAWAMHENPGPLMPLVYKGIVNGNQVGTTDTMRNWPGKPRNPADEGLARNATRTAINKVIDARLGVGHGKSEKTDADLPKVRHIIDTHIHLYDPRRPDGVPWPPKDDTVLYKPHLPDEFNRVAKPAGVTGVLIVEASDRLVDNRWVLDLVKDDPFYVGIVGNIDPYRDDFSEHLAELRKDKRFVGIRLRVQGRTIDYAHPKVRANLRILAKAGLTADILMNGKGVKTLHQVDALARAIPELRLVVDHVLGYNIDGKTPPADWQAAVRKLARNRNVHCKVSGLYQRCVIQPALQDPAHYRSLLDILWNEFGSERLIYGSNWPCTKKSGDYRSFVQLVNAYFSKKGRDASENYFWKNAARAYRLDLE